MEKIIEFEEGRSYNCKASAFSPILYNKLFPGRDFMKDMDVLSKHAGEKEGEGTFGIEEYTFFANITYMFVYQGMAPSPKQTEEQREFLEKYPSPWDWIDTFGTFSIYKSLNDIIELWGANEKKISVLKNRETAPPVK